MVRRMNVEPLACSAVLTHHWLVRRRGGEKVLEAIAELLPGADVYTLVHDAAGYEGSGIGDRGSGGRHEGTEARRHEGKANEDGNDASESGKSKIQNPKSKIVDGVGIAARPIHTSFLQ